MHWEPRHDLNADAAPDDGPLSEELALLLDGYLQQLELDGIPPDIETLVAEHPHLEADLRECAEGLQVLHCISSEVRQPEPSPRRETPGRLGDYEILREIGRGGMGVVYEARQISLNRRVALKVLPFASVLDEKQIARFRNEAQAAASLHHPNIVPVFGVGDERGVHFFAMQYVAGQPLNVALEQMSRGPDDVKQEVAPRDQFAKDASTDFAFTTRASSRSRGYCESVARLGAQVAHALAHAHERGVIHRDVKPSNLLVDRDGKVWVTDFGLARMESGTGVTMSGDLVGTLRYMSPEQARGKPAPIDARTDVYSLGVTLYELLTLQHAHPADTRHELLHEIEGVEPAAPRQLNPSIPYDLETIVLRAMARERDDRYESAAELADDLERFLAGKGPLARRLSPVDRVARWATRNRLPVAAAALAVVLLAVLSTAGWITYAHLQRQTAEALATAETHLQQSREHFQQARDAVDRFGIALSDQLAARPETESIRRQLLEDTLTYYEQFIAQAGDDASLARELAATLHKAAGVSERLGLLGPAGKRYQQAVDQYETLAAAAPHDASLRELYAQCLNDFGACLASQDDRDAAIEKYKQALALAETLSEDSLSTNQPEIICADILCDWGLLLARTGSPDQAEQKLRAAATKLEQHTTNAEVDVDYKPTLAATYNNLSYVQRGRDWQAALDSNTRALELLRQLVDDEQPVTTCGHELALCLNNRGAIQGHLGDWQSAVASHRESVTRLTQLVRVAPSVVSYRRDLAVNGNNLGQALISSGSSDESTAVFAQAERQLRELVDDYPTTIAFQSLLAGVLNNRAMVDEAADHRPAAIERYAEAIRLQSQAVEAAPSVADYRAFLDKHLVNYSRCLREEGHWVKAGEAVVKRYNLRQADAEQQLEMARQLARIAARLAESEGERKTSQQFRKVALAALADAHDAGCAAAATIPSGEQDRWAWLLSSANEEPRVVVSMAEPSKKSLPITRGKNP